MRYLNMIRNITNWPLHIKYKLGVKTPDPLEFMLKNGINCEVPKRLYHEFKMIFFENTYRVGHNKRIINQNPIIIDIGANVGFFSAFAISKFPNCNVYSYEPVGANFKQLLRNSELNPDKSFKCFNNAVCGHKGTIRINFEKHDEFTTSATIKDNDKGNMVSIEVPCLRLSDIFDDNNIDKCDFLKIDCEGAEYDVLYNTPTTYIDRIDQMVIEVHHDNYGKENLESLRDFLITNKFNLFQFRNRPGLLWAYRT